MKEIIRKYFGIPSLVILSVGILSLLVLIIGGLSPAFAEAVTVSVGFAFRRVTAFIFGIFPFSVAELLIIAAIIALVAFIVILIVKLRSRTAIVRSLVSVLCIISVLLCMYTFTLGIGYKRVGIADKLKLNTENIKDTELYETLLILKSHAEAELSEIEFDGNHGGSVMPYDLSELSVKLCEAYESLEEKHPELALGSFNSRVKPVVSSGLLTALEITGMYTFYTGEANLNTHYPDYTVPFTAAHELAHQRGISRENEANFVAFLVCISSDDAYIRYSGYLNMLEYLASSLNRVNFELRVDAYSQLDPKIRQEMSAYAKFYKKNKNQFMADLSAFFNDGYLKLSGTEGIVSYGLVTELCVGYYR